MMNTFSVTDISVVTDQNDRNLLDILGATTTDENMPSWGYNLTAIVLFAIGFFGFFLNLFVIILMCKDIQIWTPMNVILLNLVCSDFSVSIIGNPFTLTSAINHGWMFGDTVCAAYGFFMSLLGITSITTLTVLSYERYCLVSCPFSGSHLSKKGAKIAVGLIWLYSLVLTMPPLFGWGKYVSEAANISCSVNWESQTFNATSYIVFLFIFGLFVPVIVILYSYVKIIKTMRENNLRSGRVNKVESRVTNMIFVMIIAFLIAWTPYSIFALSEQFGDPELITPSLAVLPALIAKSSICYNPLIYVYMNSQFRAAWQRVHGKENIKAATNETTVNQISETSSRVECSFPNFEKKKKIRLKEKSKQNIKLIDVNKDTKLNSINESLTCTNNNNLIIVDNRKSQILHTPTFTDIEIIYPEQRAFLFTKSITKPISKTENNYELRMFSSEANIYGKAIHQLIRNNSYKSNIC